MLCCRVTSGVRYTVNRCCKPELIKCRWLVSTRKFHNSNLILYPINVKDNGEEIVRHKQSLNENILYSGIVANNRHSHRKSLESKRKQNLSPQDILNLYPQPVNTLHTIYKTVSTELGIQNALRISYEHKQKAELWHCSCTVSWPEEKTFTSNGKSKQKALHSVALQCLEWLHHSKKIKNRKPVLYERNKVKDLLQKYIDINIDPNVLLEMETLLNMYDTNIKHILDKCTHISHIGKDLLVEDNRTDNMQAFSRTLTKKNYELLDSLKWRRQLKKQGDLPILKYREQILEELEKGQILVIKGDTGCGKTTQVPQFLLDAFTEMERATDCNILISQPRRISAISLAQRVAQERGEAVGDVVGYQVHLNKVLPPSNGGILFCTTGMLLQKLYLNPNLDGYSHVILDEAHERTIETDILIVLLKEAIERNPSLKLIVMSATINAELFHNYFNCPVIEVPGRLYSVKMHFLEDMANEGIISKDSMSNYNDLNEIKQNCTRIVKVVEWICMRKPPGTILCFLPGWGEISFVKYLLEEQPTYAEKRLVFTVHSKMSNSDQSRIFESPPPGTRKIILATDIAETGITIPDVIYVVDSCVRREMRWLEDIRLPSISSYWASQANIKQRSGRAGRVQPGESYHMISKDMYAKLNPYPFPEITRSPLEEPILEIKSHTDESGEEFLGRMPNPPKSETIVHALNNLKQLGAIDDNEKLTPLGQRMVRFKMDPKLSKAMVHATIFECLDPVVGIASLFAKDNEMFTELLTNKSLIRDSKRIFHPSSDHLALYWIFREWTERNNNTSTFEMRKFCKDLGINGRKMAIMAEEFGLNMKSLKQCRLLFGRDIFSTVNKNSINEELVRAVLFSGTNLLVQKSSFGFKNGMLSKNVSELRTKNGIKAMITTDSVNHKRKEWPSPLLTYIQEQHSQERHCLLLRETTLLTPLSVLLFGQGKILSDENTHSDTSGGETKVTLQVDDIKNLTLTCDEKTAGVLLKFKEAMWSVVSYLIKTQGISEYLLEDDLEEVRAYKRQLLRTLSKMLFDAAEDINKEVITEEKSSK